MRSLAIAVVAVCLSGCSGSRVGGNEMAGTGIGAIGGGLIGNQFGKGNGKIAATVGGAVVGGVIGNGIGRQLDQRDHLLAERAQMQAMERGRAGERVAWRNPNNGHSGAYMPGPAYARSGAQCRDYTHVISIDGRAETLRGTACRTADGTWRKVG